MGDQKAEVEHFRAIDEKNDEYLQSRIKHFSKLLNTPEESLDFYVIEYLNGLPDEMALALWKEKPWEANPDDEQLNADVDVDVYDSEDIEAIKKFEDALDPGRDSTLSNF